MKKIVIANHDLGVLTPYGQSDRIWSSSILSKPFAACIDPQEAIELLRTAIQKEHTERTFVFPVDVAPDVDRLAHDDPHIAHINHLWRIKVVNAVITGQQGGKPMASTTTWKGSAEGVEKGLHLADLKSWVSSNAISNATIYTDSEKHLLEKSLQHLHRNATTLHELMHANYTDHINELIESVSLNDHPLKVQGMLEQVKQAMAAQQALAKELNA